MRSTVLAVAVASVLAGCASILDDPVGTSEFRPTDATRVTADELLGRAMDLARAWRSDAVLVGVGSYVPPGPEASGPRAPFDGASPSWGFSFFAAEGLAARGIAIAANGTELGYFESGGEAGIFGPRGNFTALQPAWLESGRLPGALRANATATGLLAEGTYDVNLQLSGLGEEEAPRWTVHLSSDHRFHRIEVDPRTWTVVEAWVQPEWDFPAGFEGCSGCRDPRAPPPPPVTYYWNGTVQGFATQTAEGYLPIPMPDAFPPYDAVVVAEVAWQSLPVDDLTLTILHPFAEDGTSGGSPLRLEAFGPASGIWEVLVRPSGQPVQRPVDVSLVVTVTFHDGWAA